MVSDMDDGIFKTGRTGLVGGRRVDIQWLWDVEKKAEIIERACRPPVASSGKKSAKQLKITNIAGC